MNNLAVAALSKGIKEKYGYMGLFVIISAWGIVALVATLMYPKNPSPASLKLRLKNKKAPTPSIGEKPIKHTEVFPPESVPESKDQNQNL